MKPEAIPSAGVRMERLCLNFTLASHAGVSVARAIDRSPACRS